MALRVCPEKVKPVGLCFALARGRGGLGDALDDPRSRYIVFLRQLRPGMQINASKTACRRGRVFMFLTRPHVPLLNLPIFGRRLILLFRQNAEETDMAVGWAGDSAVQDQIQDSLNDEVRRARANLPHGVSLEYCENAAMRSPRPGRRALPASASASCARKRRTRNSGK